MHGKAASVLQFGPVVGVRSSCRVLAYRLELPSPEMPGRLASGHIRTPRDQAALVELHDRVFSDAASGEPHGEHVTDGTDPLPCLGMPEVVVAVPTRLLSRVCNQFEDRFGTR